jgi:hypothetical protein
VLETTRNSPFYIPGLVFLFLRYKTEHPVLKIRDIWEEQITIQPSYLVDYKLIEPYYNEKLKWMTVQASFLDKQIKEKNIEAVEIKKPECVIFPIGKDSNKLIKRWI